MENRTFKLTEITRIFDIKQHFVIHLVETGVIKPLEDARGRGKSRRYSHTNLIEIGIFLYLSKLNLSHAMAAKILRDIRDFGGTLHEDVLGIISYISVIGFLDGGISPWAKIDLYPKEVSPDEALKFLLKSTIKERPGSNEGSFSYYFLLDVKNIIGHIDEKIRKL